MMEINIRNARSSLSELINRVEQGEEIFIKRRGKRVARLVGPDRSGETLPSLTEFRRKITIKGEPLSETVINSRAAERF